jgi:hypothetical protein
VDKLISVSLLSDRDRPSFKSKCAIALLFFASPLKARRDLSDPLATL